MSYFSWNILDWALANSPSEEDAGALVDYLTTIKTFLDGNPNEVVTLLLTNGDAIPVSQYGTDMTTSGLASYAYTPPGQLAISDWPTLQEFIDANTRLVMFMGKYFHHPGEFSNLFRIQCG